MVGQPDLEAGVTASTGLFYCAAGAGCEAWVVAGDFADVGFAAGLAARSGDEGIAVAVIRAGSIQFNRSCTL